MNQVKLDTTECDRIAAKLGANVDVVIRRAAFDIEKLAKDKAPWDTTALKNSIYTSTSKDDGYSKASAEAKSVAAKKANRKIETEQFPQPEKLGYAHVGPCVNYAAAVEFGHGFGVSYSSSGDVDFAKGFVPPQPYMIPAAEEVMKRYNNGSEWENIHK